MMLKLNAVDLKGFKLALINGKETYVIGTLDTVEPKDAKNGLKLHLVAGTKWAGDMVADLPEKRVLMFKGSLYSRNSATVDSETGRVGSLT